MQKPSSRLALVTILLVALPSIGAAGDVSSDGTYRSIASILDKESHSDAEIADIKLTLRAALAVLQTGPESLVVGPVMMNDVAEDLEGFMKRGDRFAEIRFFTKDGPKVARVVWISCTTGAARIVCSSVSTCYGQ